MSLNMFSYLRMNLDNIGLHRVENPSNTDVAVSLHLYCPPFDTCNVFNKSGKKTPAKVTFWSRFGKRIKVCLFSFSYMIRLYSKKLLLLQDIEG